MTPQILVMAAINRLRPRKSLVWQICVSVFLGLGACTPKNFAPIPSQTWQGVNVQIETRPSPPVQGMNEMWVMLTDDRHRPVFDVIVNLRATSIQEWQQGIQDGRTGVFRRAIRITDPQQQKIEVRLTRRGQETVLEFPMVGTAADSSAANSNR